MQVSQSTRPSAGRDSLVSVLVVIIVLAIISVLLNLLTGLPDVEGWDAAALAVIGVLVTLVVARTADSIQREVRKLQQEIQDFLMGKVNSRTQRTSAVIEICEKSDHKFRAATFFPAVGIRDNPDSEPMVYLKALEDALRKGVHVQLIFAPFDEARKYCKGSDDFSTRCLVALDEVEERLNELQKRADAGNLKGTLWKREIPGAQLTLNICYNDSAALIYHMSLDGKDAGAGFKSSDDRVREVAKGGFSRYRELLDDAGEGPT